MDDTATPSVFTPTIGDCDACREGNCPSWTSNLYPLDSSGIIHIAALRPYHSNTFRLSITLCSPVDPQALQSALDAITPRFPTIIAGIVPGRHDYFVAPVGTPPRVVPDDEGFRHLDQGEIAQCGMRVRYDNNTVHLDMFHSLTDGAGALSLIVTLIAEYLKLAHDVTVPSEGMALDPREAPRPEELRDDYLTHAGNNPAPANNARVYQLPGLPLYESGIRVTTFEYPASSILKASRNLGTSVTGFTATVMLEAVSRIQQKHLGGKRPERLQIAVPADIRRQFKSSTLRNFSLLAYPRMNPEQFDLPFPARISLVTEQLKHDFSRESMKSTIATYTKAQHNPLVSRVPLKLKTRIARTVHHLFGAHNSCITLSNLGAVSLPKEMLPYVSKLSIYLMPRIESPYNFSMITYSDVCSMSFTRFCNETELIECFQDIMEKRLQENAGETLTERES
ncbi:MAG: hypothetical protein IJC51_00400 [Eggerthellaceae bacterium]|nr:hypothetical protein [Eggerthellaceae bacterium]